ncbi:MAG: N-acetyltransferase [Bacteroidota bacterium]
MVRRLGHSEAYLPELTLVAEEDDQVIGFIMLTQLSIQGEDDSNPALALAPVAVLPEFQGQGIGGALVNAAHEKAKAAGHQIIILLGHADYYPRFGYQQCQKYGIQLPFEVPPENAMVLGLAANSLEGVSGVVVYPTAFFE